MKEQKTIVLAILCVIPTIIILSFLWAIPEVRLWSYHTDRLYVVLMIFVSYCSVTFPVIIADELFAKKHGVK